MTTENIRNMISQMIKTNRMHKRAIETVVNDIGIHRGRHLVLMHLAKKDKFKSQKEIAEHIGITQAALTGALSSLERDGLISRTTGADSRFNEISITEKGKDIISLSREHFARVDAAAIDGIDDDELEAFYNCLTKIHNNLEKFLEKKDNK